ncbi:MAG: TlpA family protein disulfide reductase [Elusimicrobiota bacterium]|jgi:thiol-disulfide isomerase/thioredoxin|nr:TlpA family protein disulfide reductase [Elusimicrobiota bacterium]
MNFYKKFIVVLTLIFLSNFVFAQKAVDFSLKDLNGKNIKLSDYKGKAVFLDFWATWCPPCRASIPAVIDLHKKTENNPSIAIIGINLSENKTKVADFVKGYDMSYTILLGEQSIAAAYQVRSIPTFIIIDKEGKLVKKYVGYFPNIEKEWLKQLEILSK